MRSLAIIGVLLALIPVGSARAFHGGGMRGGGGGGWHGPVGHPGSGFHRGPFFHRPFFGTSVFIGGFWDPFFYPGFYPYVVPYPVYAYPGGPAGWGEAPTEEAPPPGEGEEAEAETENAPSDESQRATYGLVQLRGVPDGASVDLNGRFWLSANDLDHRWLALPEGEHTLAIRVGRGEPVVRRIAVTPGKSQVLRFGPFPHDRG